MSDTASQLTDHELWLEGVDQANKPYIPWRGGLFWNGSAWEKMTGSSGYLSVQASILTSPLSVQGTISVNPNSSSATAAAVVSVGASSTALVAANPNRKGVIITNASSANISLSFDGNAAVLYSGVTLYPGQSFVMDGYSFTTAAIAAIASVAGSNAGYQEYQ